MRTSLRRLVTGRNRVRRRLGRVSSQTLIGPFILHFRFSIGPCGVLLLVGCRASSSCHPPHTGDADCRSTSGPLPPQPGAQELRPEEPTRSGQFIPGRPPARRRPRRPRFRRRSSRRPGRRPSRPRRRRRRRPQGALVQGSRIRIRVRRMSCPFAAPRSLARSSLITAWAIALLPSRGRSSPPARSGQGRGPRQPRGSIQPRVWRAGLHLNPHTACS